VFQQTIIALLPEGRIEKGAQGVPVFKKLILAAALALASMSSLPLFAGSCPGTGSSADPSGAFCGSLTLNTATYPYAKKPPSSYDVKFCRMSDGSGYCRSGSTLWAPDGWGIYSWQQFMAFDGYNYSMSPYYVWYVFAWKDADYWGSSSVPVLAINAPAAGSTGIGINAPPRPLPPTPQYPAGNIVIHSDQFPVRWSSGLDAERTSTSWPVTYDLYYKWWVYGPEPTEWVPAAGGDYPCNPDQTGYCSTYVTQMPEGSYRWKMVAKMDVSDTVSYTVRPAVFTTESASTYFSVDY
jgi:hypothetical protein